MTRTLFNGKCFGRNVPENTFKNDHRERARRGRVFCVIFISNFLTHVYYIMIAGRLKSENYTKLIRLR